MEAIKPLEYLLAIYCDVNAVDVDELRSFLMRSKHTENAKRFWAALADAIEHNTLSKEEYERLTGEDFDTQDDLIDWLKKLRADLLDQN